VQNYGSCRVHLVYSLFPVSQLFKYISPRTAGAQTMSVVIQIESSGKRNLITGTKDVGSAQVLWASHAHDLETEQDS